MTRREWIHRSSAALLLLRKSAAGAEPENISYPLSTLKSGITPPDRFFVRDHFPPPEISLRTWRLRIEGRVDAPYDISYSDLVELPTKTIEAVLECAGNVANGSAASNGIWEGVPLSVLIERARPQAGASFVLLQGADRGRLLDSTAPALPYSQKVAFEKCMDPASLVTFKLNNLALPARNGFPARALLPGWYGMDSVKWLRRIAVFSAEDRETDFERSGFSRVYNRVSHAGTVTRLSEIQVKSVIAWPSGSFKLPAARYDLWGFAWSGAAPIRKVMISMNAGRQWQPAVIERQASKYAWTKWTCSWNARPGDYVLMSRAIDSNGQEQPLTRDHARKDSYELNWCVPIAGSIR